ncbi:unnamed protein product, partial [Adineta steineri]
PVYRRLLNNHDEKYIWYIVTYPSNLIISAILIIVITTRQRAQVKNQQSYKSVKMSSEIDYNSSLISIQTNLYKYGGPILMILGTVSCVLSLIVFTKKNHRKNPCAIYLVACNIGYLLQIYTTMLLAILSNGYNIDPTVYSLSFCHFRYYALLLSAVLSPSYLILASIDRILITSPNALTRQRSTLRLTYICIIGITLFWLLAHMHTLFLTRIVEPVPNLIICSFQPRFYIAFINYYTILIQDILIPLLMIILGVWADPSDIF